MTVITHPRSEALAAFARGELPADELAMVAEHIGACAACCAIISRVPEDSLAGLAREAGVTDPKPLGEVGKTAEPTSPTCRQPGASTPVRGSDKFPPALAEHPRYDVLRELGAGGMGVVYKAEHRVMGRLVALKVMAPHLTAKAGAVERFRKEVRAAAQLNHPNIVTAHDADEAGGLHFLVMEYVEGTSLDRLVAKKGPLPVPLACSFIRQAALGLQNAHEKGMVHRDIKPQNMMVTRKAQVKVMDFGLARFVRNDEDEAETRPGGRLPFGAGRTIADPLTNPNLLMGTPDYLSPEQAKNSHTVDSRSDLYSLGCTLFFLLTGKPPFASAQSLIDKLIAHTEDAPPSIRELRPDVPAGVAVVLEKLLAKKPDDRYDTAADVAVAIQPFTRIGAEVEAKPSELELVAAPASGVGIGEDEGDTGPVTRERTLTDSERPRRSKRLKRLKARPWWEKTGVKISAVVLLPLTVVITIIIVGKAKGPLPADSAKAQPTVNPTPTKGKPAKALPFLFVVPSQGVHCPDYLPVKKRLNDAKIPVVTASGQGGFASPTPFDPNGSSVKVDVKIADVDALEYSGIAFTGFNVEEYIDTRAGGPHNPVTKATHNVIEKMVFLGKPVGAICVGEAVLAIHGVLDGKPVAKSPMLMKSFPRLQNLIPGATWQDQGVVAVDGKVITARGAPDAREFADALIEALKSE